MNKTAQAASEFYNTQYCGSRYAPVTTAEQHRFYPTVTAFVKEFGLSEKSCVEIGCGRGAFQNVVENYTGIDLADSVRSFLRKPFYQASATSLPFPNNHFDAAWSYAVLEHVSDPEAALVEMRRVLKPGGLLLLHAAWQRRTWAAQGYPVRPYRDFSWSGKLVKASIPIRESVFFRGLHIFPRRMARLAACQISRPTRFRFKQIQPNYETYWMADSDAVSSMDPYEAILWFVSRGDVCVNYPTPRSQFFVRTGHLIFRIQKNA